MTRVAPDADHARPLLGLREQPGRLALAVRLPRPLYHRGWGRLLGHTFLLIAHEGGKTGQRRETVAMALSYDPKTSEVVVCSAWGPNTEWIHNLRAGGALEIQIGRESYAPAQRFLCEDESVAVVAEFRRHHPWRSRVMASILGWGLIADGRAVASPALPGVRRLSSCAHQTTRARSKAVIRRSRVTMREPVTAAVA